MKLSDEFLAYLELRNDMFFDKISKSEIRSNINKVFDIVDEFIVDVKGRDVHELLEEANIKVNTLDSGGEFFKVKFRAQFEQSKNGDNAINIYSKSLKDLANITKIDYETVLKISLLHEYFHYLEAENDYVVSEKVDQVVTSKIFKLERRANIGRWSEIGAQRFAQKMLSLDYMANYVDILYLLNTDNLTKDKLKELEAEFNLV
ncbi:MAG: hypothetical protein ACK5G7_04140 [Erysipelotrichaceae bacterium]